MRFARNAFVLLAFAVAYGLFVSPAAAVSPQNPYRSFNLSGINYGSMQWERDQRAGRRVWPYYNTPSQSYYRGGNVSVGGVGAGTMLQGGGIQSSPRGYRRWRR